MQAAPDEDIPPELRVNGYRLGRDVLPLSTNEESDLKYVLLDERGGLIADA